MTTDMDTGATYTVWPSDRLSSLGVEPGERWPFVLADGREVIRDVAWARVVIAGRSQPTIVVFGDPESEPLLGPLRWKDSCSPQTPWAAA